MKKLISAVTSLCMAATMVSAVVPATVGAADATKGFSIKTYDDTKPGIANGASEVTIKKTDIGANGYNIPAAVYLTESTDNDTGSLMVALTTDSPDLQFAVRLPDKKYYDSEKAVTLSSGSGTTDQYITFGGIMDDMDGYMAPGRYIFGCEPSMTAAGAENYFIGLSWNNDGRDYKWAGTKSDDYPLYAFDITVPANIAAGTYHVDFHHYDTDPDEKVTVMSPMIEARKEKPSDPSHKYSLEESNLTTSGLTIKIEGDGPVVTTTTTTPPTPITTTTTTPPVVGDKDFNFKIVDANGNSTANAAAGAELTLNLKVNAGNNTCAGMDAQYDLGGLELVQMGKKAAALGGATINTNEAENRISIMSVDSGTGEPTAVTNDGTVSVIKVKIPANAAEGTQYTVDLVSSELKVFKEGGSGDKYTAGVTPFVVKVGDGPITTTTKDPTPVTTTTTVDPNAQFKFSIVDANGNATASADAGAEVTLNLKVDAGNNTCAGMDAQYDLGGLELVQMGKKAAALGGATINTNEAENRISIMSVDSGTGEPTAVTNGGTVSVIKVKVPANAANGTKYTVDLVKSELKVFKEGGSGDKYSAAVTPFVLTVGTPNPETSTTTTTTTPPGPTTTTTVDPNAQFKFSIVDANGNATANADAGAELTLNLKVDAGNNTCAGMDAQYDLGGLELVQMGKKAAALGGATINTNEDEARISIMSVDSGTGEPTAVTNGGTVSVIKVKVPANAANGTKYTVDLVKSELKVFKEGGSGDKYSAAVTPFVITVGTPVDPTTTTTTTTITSTTTTTTTPPVEPTTTTTTTPPAGKLAPTWGDVNCDGSVNVADVVVLNRYLNDPTYPVSDQGKVNGDVKDPQDKSGAAVDPAKVQLTAADSETILKSIVELVTLPQ